MTSIKFFLLFVFMVFAASSFAGDSSSGCGAGWYVFKENSLVSSSLRATTNAIFLNTVGMTFGTSNWAKHNIVKNEKRAIHYAEVNFHQLMIDVAQGDGDYLRVFAEVVNYQGEMENFASLLQQNYSVIYSKTNLTPVSMYNNFKQVVEEIII